MMCHTKILPSEDALFQYLSKGIITSHVNHEILKQIAHECAHQPFIPLQTLEPFRKKIGPLSLIELETALAYCSYEERPKPSIEETAIKVADRAGSAFNQNEIPAFDQCASAYSTGQFESAKKLIELNESLLKKADENGCTLLHLAVQTGHVNSVRYLLRKESPVTVQNHSGKTPLHYSVLEESNPEMVQLLLDHGADPNQQDDEGLAPLHLTAKNGHQESAKVLIENGAHIDLMDQNDVLPFDLALSWGQDDFLYFFLEPVRRLNRNEVPSFSDFHSDCLQQAKRENLIEEQIFFLLKIGHSFSKQNNFLAAAKVLNCAIAILQTHKTLPFFEKFLLAKLQNLEKGFFKANHLKLHKKIKSSAIHYRTWLSKVRKDCKRAQQQGETIQDSLFTLTENLKQILTHIILEAQEQLGPPPVSWSCIGMGSMARSEMCPYSDVEFAFLIEEDSAEALSYFRNLSKLLELKIINLGETKFPVFGPDESSPTPDGFCLDTGGNTPLGAPGLYELIGTPKRLAAFQSDLWIERNIILANALSAVCLIAGDEDLFSNYLIEQDKVLNLKENSSETNLKNLSFCLLAKHLQEFRPDLSEEKEKERAFGIKKELYRPFQEILGSFALFFKLKGKNTFKRIDELTEKGIFLPEGARNLKIAMGKVLTLRLKTHLFYEDEKEFLCHPEIEKENDPSLLYLEENLRNVLIEVYRTLIPFHAAATEFFYTKNKGGLQRNIFYNASPNETGRLFQKEQNFENALSAYQEALSLDPENIEILEKVINMEFVRENNLAGLAHAEKVKGLIIKRYGDQCPRLVTAYIGLAIGLYKFDRYSEALEFLQKASAIAKSSFGYVQKLMLGQIYRVSSAIYGAMKDEQLCLDNFQKSLAIVEDLHGKISKKAAIVYNQIAVVFEKMQRPQIALEYQKKRLSVSQQLHGEHHPSLGQIYTKISVHSFALKEYQAAWEATQNALRILMMHYDEHHPEVLSNRDNLWKLLFYLNRFEESLIECKELFLYYCRIEPHNKQRIRDYLEHLIRLMDVFMENQNNLSVIKSIIEEVYAQGCPILGRQHELIIEMHQIYALKVVSTELENGIIPPCTLTLKPTVSFFPKYKKPVTKNLPFKKTPDKTEADNNYRLGCRYQNGEGVAKDPLKAFDHFKKAADLGHREAQNILAFKYAFGLDIKKDFNSAVLYWKKAADQGHAQAQTQVGKCYLFGDKIPRNKELSLKYLQLAANQKEPDGLYLLGLQLLETKDKESLNQAIRYLEIASHKHHISATVLLGECYFIGEGVEKSYQKAIHFWKKAAILEHPVAIYHLGHCHAAGAGVEKDLNAANKCFEMAALLDYEPARQWLNQSKETAEKRTRISHQHSP